MITTKDERQAIRERMLKLNEDSTHYEGCAEHHLPCLIIHLVDELDHAWKGTNILLDLSQTLVTHILEDANND